MDGWDGLAVAVAGMDGVRPSLSNVTFSALRRAGPESSPQPSEKRHTLPFYENSLSSSEVQ